MTRFFLNSLIFWSIGYCVSNIYAQNTIPLVTFGYELDLDAQILARKVSATTSVELDPKVKAFTEVNDQLLAWGWVWAPLDKILKHLKSDKENGRKIGEWLRRGGLLIVTRSGDMQQLRQLSRFVGFKPRVNGHWQKIPPDHELMRSFYLLPTLPRCGRSGWQIYSYDRRMAILSLSSNFLDFLLKKDAPSTCPSLGKKKQAHSLFINILMVSLTLGYKKDQVQTDAILRRL